MKRLYLTITIILFSFASFAQAPITGITTICAGGTTTLSDATPGGTWTTPITSSIVSVGLTSGVVTAGTALGMAIISYTVGGSTVTATVTVTANAGAIISPYGDSICAGFVETLTNTTTGGTWSMSNSTVATIVSASGILTDVIAGIDTVIYTLPTGCFTKQRLVFGSATTGTITGSSIVCTGSMISLSDIITGGTWSMTNANATITTGGVVTGVTTGTDTALYSIGCTSGSTPAKHVITINSSSAGTITGPTSVCLGATIYLSDATTGGIWSTGTTTGVTTNVSVNLTSGAVTGVSTGVSNVTYSITSCTGLHTIISMTVNPTPASIYVPSSVCPGSSITLSDATTGGAWSTATPPIASISATSGMFTGVSAGTTTVTYMLSTGCFATAAVTVGPPSSGTISGPSTVCGGYTINLTETIPGGVWSCTNGNATVNSTGVVTGAITGVDTVNYTITTTCGTAVATHIVTITSSVAPITGPSSVCAGSSITLSDATPGGTWTSSSPTIAGMGSTTGAIYGISAGTATITYTIAGCGGILQATTTITVIALPAVVAAATLACGGAYTLTASGAATYSWTPVTGLSCSTCASTTINPAASGTYNVSGTASGCTATAHVTINVNRISGYITYTGGSSTDSFRVWLIQYTPSDSLIIATDSTVSCMDGGTPYYVFNTAPSGSYMIKAKLFGSAPGTSGYIPTYGVSSPNWSTASSVTHASATDTMHINMIYGTVPPGPGFISGNVYFGAGKGTNTDMPDSNMLIYLEDAANHVLTYTYTDGTGAYSFNGLAYDNYIIYPEAYDYYTTPSVMITLNAAHSSATSVDFKQHTTFGTITPIYNEGVKTINNNASINLFPNPASSNITVQWQEQATGNANLVISDMLGRDVYKTTVSINAANGQLQLNLSNLKDGVYLVTIKSDNIYFSSKLLIGK